MSADPQPHVIALDDDAEVRRLVAEYLEQNEFRVTTVASGAEFNAAMARDLADLVVLDLRLPGEDGMQIARRLREESAGIPILMLTGRAEEADRVMGLELGADDYLTKPFSMRELVARVRAQVRRASKSGSLAGSNEVLRGGVVELDVDAHEVRVGGIPVAMRPKEFELLESLMRRLGRLASRETLISEVWGADHFGDTKTLDVHIKRLREKIEPEPSSPRHIVTVRGLGYKFVDS
jgi:two-component system response regulator RegX3